MYKPCTSWYKIESSQWIFQREKQFILSIHYFYFNLYRNQIRATTCCLSYHQNIFFSSLKLDISSNMEYIILNEIRYLITNSVNTHIDCCIYKITVSLYKNILKATKQGNLENLVKELVRVPLHLFLLSQLAYPPGHLNT